MSIKYKLIILTLLVSIIPLLIVSSISINSSLKALEKESFKKISIERLTKKKSIENYFSLIADQVSVMAHRKTTIEAAENFIKGFNNFAIESNLSIVDKEIRKKKLINHYEAEFGAEYSKQNNKRAEGLEQIMATLDSNQLLIQSEFISENKEALGSKHLMNQGSTNATYNRTHVYHHPNFREFLEEFGFYDIFIIDADTGNIVYSVYKELDFATSLKNGPYSKSSLGELYHKIISSGKSEVVMTDYKTYFPSYDGPASFIGAPILKDSKIIAILAYQISFDRINQITTFRPSSDKSLETFIVGPDFMMRSDTLADKENRNVKASFRNPELGSIVNDYIKAGLRGEDFSFQGKDYLNRDVFGSLGPIDILGHRWVIKTIILEDEALESVNSLKKILFLLILISIAVVSFVGFYFSSQIAAQLKKIAEKLFEESGKVSSYASKVSEVASSLSEASTEQAASLQETVASIDEISSMIQRNSDNASTSLEAANRSMSSVDEGKRTVDEMQHVIRDISSSSDNLVRTVEESNKKVSEVVGLINSIAEKTKVINDIVFQTKLLAFNASVEAARAGEHGKGFSVVAEEVGNLATMSGRSAKEIEDLLSGSVSRVNSIVQESEKLIQGLIEDNKINLKRGLEASMACGESLNHILNSSEEVNQMVGHIATASNEQATGVKEVAKAMAQLDQATQQNNQSANESSELSNLLSQQSKALSDVVLVLNEFTLGKKK